MDRSFIFQYILKSSQTLHCLFLPNSLFASFYFNVPWKTLWFRHETLMNKIWQQINSIQSLYTSERMWNLLFFRSPCIHLRFLTYGGATFISLGNKSTIYNRVQLPQKKKLDAVLSHSRGPGRSDKANDF